MQSLARSTGRVSLLSNSVRQGSVRGTVKAACRPMHLCQRRTQTMAVSARGGTFGQSSSIGLVDRAAAALPYLLPLIAAYPYGKYLFQAYPAILHYISPIMPMIKAYYSVPMASLVVFLAVYAGIVTNEYWSRFVRYNAMQAVLLDIALIVPRLLEQFLGHPQTEAMMQFHVSFHNSVFILCAGAVAFGIFMCLTGQTARIPLVSDAVDQQVR
jgi:uncharacterized membrane protein